MSVTTFTKTGSKSSTKLTLDKQVFAAEVANHQLLQQVYDATRANSRAAIAHTKTRGEVRGGGRKPWRQKGTGRARFGSIRNPIWRGGGIAFGPRNQVNHTRATNQKSRKIALIQALSLANTSGRLSVIDSINSSGKTAALAKLLNKVDFTSGLIVLNAADDKLKRAVANLPGISTVLAAKLSATDILDSNGLLLDKAAIDTLTKRLKD